MEFAKLPWQQLLPSIQVMETLVAVSYLQHILYQLYFFIMILYGVNGNTVKTRFFFLQVTVNLKNDLKYYQTIDKLKSCIMKILLSFAGVFSKMYRINTCINLK